jgi:hypothetical protein
MISQTRQGGAVLWGGVSEQGLTRTRTDQCKPLPVTAHSNWVLFNFLQEDDDIGFRADKGANIPILPIN